MRHAIIANRIGQRFRDVALPHKVLKGLRSPLACNDLIAHEKVFSCWFLVLSKTTRPIPVGLPSKALTQPAATEKTRYLSPSPFSSPHEQLKTKNLPL